MDLLEGGCSHLDGDAHFYETEKQVIEPVQGASREGAVEGGSEKQMNGAGHENGPALEKEKGGRRCVGTLERKHD